MEAAVVDSMKLMNIFTDRRTEFGNYYFVKCAADFLRFLNSIFRYE
jgi:hypothetical protein